MTISASVAIAEYMKDQLNQHGLNESITIVQDLDPATLGLKKWATLIRTYLPQLDLESAGETRIALIQQNMQSETFARCYTMETHEIACVLLKRINLQNITEVGDETLLLSDQINAYFRCRRRALIQCDGCQTEARWINVRQQPIWSPEKVDEKNLFSTATIHKWTALREICCC